MSTRLPTRVSSAAARLWSGANMRAEVRRHDVEALILVGEVHRVADDPLDLDAGLGGARRARSRDSSGVGSSATTSAPAFASGMATFPSPAPTSRTFTPGAGFAAAAVASPGMTTSLDNDGQSPAAQTHEELASRDSMVSQQRRVGNLRREVAHRVVAAGRRAPRPARPGGPVALARIRPGDLARCQEGPVGGLQREQLAQRPRSGTPGTPRQHAQLRVARAPTPGRRPAGRSMSTGRAACPTTSSGSSPGAGAGSIARQRVVEGATVSPSRSASSSTASQPVDALVPPVAEQLGVQRAHAQPAARARARACAPRSPRHRRGPARSARSRS